MVARYRDGRPVSPELMLRPSLSGQGHDHRLRLGLVSPELMLRPSLSGRLAGHVRRLRGRVAGAYAPAFVERVDAPDKGAEVAEVSPELMLRPSLSEPEARELHLSGDGVAGADAPAFVERSSRQGDWLDSSWCRRSLCSGLR